jgi:membrane dipeptidase
MGAAERPGAKKRGMNLLNDIAMRAKTLHEECFVADAHFDLMPLVLEKRLKGRKKVIETDYLPKLRSGGMDLVISSIYIKSEYLPEMALRKALDQISALYAEMEESPGLFVLCRSYDDILRARERGELAIILSFEGVEPLGSDLDLLRIFHALGVRGVGIAWSRRNAAADGCFFKPVEEGRKGGLTDFGVRLINEAARLGMYLDVSHLNDEGLSDVFRFYPGPVIASHSNCRTIAGTMRNLTDDQIRLLASGGGLMGMNVCSTFVGDVHSSVMTEAELADHADRIKSLAGAGAVGLGFDFCDEMRDFSGPGPFENYDCIKGYENAWRFTEQLLQRGYSEGEIKGILGENLLNFLQKAMG